MVLLTGAKLKHVPEECPPLVTFAVSLQPNVSGAGHSSNAKIIMRIYAVIEWTWFHASDKARPVRYSESGLVESVAKAATQGKQNNGAERSERNACSTEMCVDKFSSLWHFV
jgi:hypothetical protein